MLKIKILNWQQAGHARDLQRAPNLTRARCSKKKKVYEEEFGVFGGAPFGALLGDYEFTKVQKTRVARKDLQRSSAAHAPSCGGGAGVFNMESFTNLDAPRDIAKIFDTTEYAKWKSFRQSEDSRYVALWACLIS